MLESTSNAVWDALGANVHLHFRIGQGAGVDLHALDLGRSDRLTTHQQPSQWDEGGRAEELSERTAS